VTTKTILEKAVGIKRYLREQNNGQAKRESEELWNPSRRRQQQLWEVWFLFTKSELRLGFGAD